MVEFRSAATTVDVELEAVMNECPQQSPPEPRTSGKQRALNALIFLLVTAVCVQAALLWEMGHRINETVAQLDKLANDAEGWKVVPNSGANDPDTPVDTSSPRSDPDRVFLAPWSADPFTSDPFSGIDRMRQEVDRLISQMQARSGVGGTALGARRLTVEDAGDCYIAKVDIPGADQSDFSVEVNDQWLEINLRHNQSADTDQNGRKMFQQRVSGQCTLRKRLPEPVDASEMTSTVKDGLLVITIPKLAAKPDTSPSQSVR